MTERETKRKLLYAEVATPDWKSGDAIDVHSAQVIATWRWIYFAKSAERYKESFPKVLLSLCAWVQYQHVHIITSRFMWTGSQSIHITWSTKLNPHHTSPMPLCKQYYHTEDS